MAVAGGRVVVRGGGDLGSGVSFRLHQAGFEVVVLELPAPLVVRRPVAFAEAVYAGECQVEGVRARRAGTLAEAEQALAAGLIPVLVDAEGAGAPGLGAPVLVDARMLKRDPGPQPGAPAFVVGLGPEFVAGGNCQAVVETNRGHNLGRVLWRGAAEPNTGQPGTVAGQDQRRIVRAPVAGAFSGEVEIGAQVTEGQRLGHIDGVPVPATLTGVLRGLVHTGLVVTPGMKLGDIDPRATREYCFTISDKSLAIGGGVLEAVLAGGYRPPALSGRAARERGAA